MEWYNETSKLFMSRGYLRENQTVEQRIKEMAEHSGAILGKGPEYVNKLENYMQKGYYVIPTPVWKNFYTDTKETAISCFGSYISDSVESIVIKSAEVALQNKIGGGSSGTFQDVRARGSKIGTEGFSNGSVSMMEIYQQVSGTISQPNRRGHFSATQDIDHGDAFEFMNARTEGHKIQDISTGLKISDDFMERLLQENKDAEEKFKRLIRARYETGFHYIFFTDTVNRNTVDVYRDKGYTINHSNMCVGEWTEILTDKGNKRIKDLEGQKVNVWNGEEFSEVTVFKTGENKKLIGVHLDNYFGLACTPEHKWYITEEGETKEVRTSELKVGDELIRFNLPEPVHNDLTNFAIWFKREKEDGVSYNVLKRELQRIGVASKYNLEDDLIQVSNKNYELLKDFDINMEDFQIINEEDVLTVKVEVINTFLPGTHDTYCFTEPKRHMGMFNGILTGQCQEIALPNSEKETFVCNLLGMNLVEFDEWKDTDAIEIGIYFMDSMLTDFINKTKAKKEVNEDYYNVLYKPAVTFAERHRSMGMGASGLHSFLQSKNVPFDSIAGRAYNKIIFQTIHDQAYAASEKMALEYGKPEMLQEEKYKRRHCTLLAVAPNTSSSFILEQQSQSIEPMVSNYYVKDVAKTRISFRNPYLEKLLEEKGFNNEDVWLSILKNEGSVRHLDFLSDDDKDVFKTFIEIPQMSVIEMAADRQKFIDQSQSLNLMVGIDTTPDEVAYWIIKAWKLGIKTLYYQLNVSSAQDFTNKRANGECSSCAG